MPSRVTPLVMRLGQLTIPELMYSALSRDGFFQSGKTPNKKEDHD
jgi:hypothetical protein